MKAAKGGAIQAAKLILERTLPALKRAAKTLTLPDVGNGEPRANAARACGQGDITANETATLMQAISAQA